MTQPVNRSDTQSLTDDTEGWSERRRIDAFVVHTRARVKLALNGIKVNGTVEAYVVIFARFVEHMGRKLHCGVVGRRRPRRRKEYVQRRSRAIHHVSVSLKLLAHGKRIELLACCKFRSSRGAQLRARFAVQKSHGMCLKAKVFLVDPEVETGEERIVRWKNTASRPRERENE